MLQSTDGHRRIVAVAPSYAGFIACAEGRPVTWVRPPSGAPDVRRLLDAAASMGGAPVDVVAIDMPLSEHEIIGRRPADQAISKAFGKAGASVHSPNATRPGPHGRQIHRAFEAAGFTLAIERQSVPRRRALIEVFPLAALVRLMGVTERPPYKVGKISRYWPDCSRAERLEKLFGSWRAVTAALRTHVPELGIDVPQPDTLRYASALKPYEDALDAVICAWVGDRFLERAAEPFGVDGAAVWVPTAPLR